MYNTLYKLHMIVQADARLSQHLLTDDPNRRPCSRQTDIEAQTEQSVTMC